MKTLAGSPRWPATALAMALVVSIPSGCRHGPVDPSPPSMATVAGEYSAGTFGALAFTTTVGGETIDWLGLGAELTLELASDGTTGGRLHIPVPEGDWSTYFEEEDRLRGSLEADMVGSWTLDGTTVLLEQEADSFVRDLAFRYHDGVLTAERAFGDLTVHVVLVKS